jgi:PTS system mannose-specific IID component
MFAVQGSWNYEVMLGPGIGFCVEPALRELPGGADGAAYHEALARETRFFNAHPYLAAVAIGSLIRAELDGQPAPQIERFRTAMCGPLGSLGDRLVWAGWLPFCSLAALLAFGLGAGPLVVVVLFLGLYNAGHIGLRAWGVSTGWRSGLRVASALGTPLLRHGPQYLARAVLFLAGVALPLAIARVLGGRAKEITLHQWLLAMPAATLAALVLAAVLIRLPARVEGWRAALAVLGVLILISISR